jgi:peptidylprolyl isomerase
MSNKKAKFTTTAGDFIVELFTDKSPITAGNFEELVEKGFYNGTRFHRIIKDFMIQGGDPLSKFENKRRAWGTGGAEAIEDEFITGLSNLKGTLSMANSGPQSGSSQFFLNLVDNTYLDFDKKPFNSKHPVFGQVIEGMDVIEKIGLVATNAHDQPREDIKVEKAEIIN